MSAGYWADGYWHANYWALAPSYWAGPGVAPPAPAGNTFLDYVAADVDALLALGADPTLSLDLDVFMSADDGFAVTATHPSIGDVVGIFTDEQLDPGQGDPSLAQLLCKSSVVETVAIGDTVTVDGVAWTVAGRRPDGLGLTALVFNLRRSP